MNLRAGLLDGSVEVKIWRPEQWDSVFVEVAMYSRVHGKYIDSGLAVTSSSSWAFVGLDCRDRVISTIVVSTEKLRRLIEGKEVIEGARGSANATRGVRISIAELVRYA